MLQDVTLGASAPPVFPMFFTAFVDRSRGLSNVNGVLHHFLQLLLASSLFVALLTDVLIHH